LVNKFLVPAGFKDSLNFDASIEHKYKNTIINYFRDNGFTLIKTPLIEFSKNLDNNTLSLKTNKKKDQLSIRNDITPQIIRIASSRLANKIRPLKLCYYGEVVRKVGTILRPERQFQQVGAEIIGSESYKADVEIINLAYETLKKIGVKNIVIEITAPFFLDSLLKKIIDKDLKNQLKKFIKSHQIDWDHIYSFGRIISKCLQTNETYLINSEIFSTNNWFSALLISDKSKISDISSSESISLSADFGDQPKNAI